MRVFLSNQKSGPSFADALEDACRAAGIKLDVQPSQPSRPRARHSSRIEQIGDIARDLRMSMLSSMVDAYMEHQRDRKVRRVRRTTDPKAIAGELGITDQMSRTELTRLRRRFAFDNHPDRVDYLERDAATRRMMIANMLIDGAMKQRLSR
jgi:hypothetical protein